MYQPENFELNQLVSKIESYQELGTICYLRLPETDYEILVSPTDSALASVNSLSAGEPFDPLEVKVSLEASKDTDFLTFRGCIHDGLDVFSTEHIKGFLIKNPLADIESLKTFLNLIASEFGSVYDWRVWTCLFENLPEIEDSVLNKLFVPLLEAGELGNGTVPALTETLLAANGWDNEKITNNYSNEERRIRLNRQAFLEETGYPISLIKSSEDLTDAVIPVIERQGGMGGVEVIKCFMFSHKQTDDPAIMIKVIEPFLSSFGIEGHQEILSALTEFDWYYPDEWSTYKGGFSWYGDW